MLKLWLLLTTLPYQTTFKIVVDAGAMGAGAVLLLEGTDGIDQIGH